MTDRRWRWLVFGAATISLALYVASFYLPDYYIAWAVYKGPPAIDAMYFFPEMVSSIPRSWHEYWSGFFWQVVGTMIGWQESNLWSVPLDWAGWAGHGAFLLCLAMIAAGWSRTAVASAATGLVCAVARNWTVSLNAGFLAGYYLWIASLACAGSAAVLQTLLHRRRRRAAAAGDASSPRWCSGTSGRT
ncbi:MAG: hypothetical protein KY476_18930 [Planctomycetes bacterium]|nr:hypothetical protein [Planctomycetota bacterium]